jgi:hypothetical protein
MDLVHGGRNIKVTNENKEAYVRLIVDYHTFGKVEQQFNAIKLGMYEILPEHALSIFDINQLEWLISGQTVIDYDDWKSNTEYVGYTETSLTITMFWEVVKVWNNDKRQRFIHFVTGSHRVPALGFSRLTGRQGEITPFKIQRIGIVGLPVAHTCFNVLDLPEFLTREDLERKLTMSMEEAGGFTLG